VTQDKPKISIITASKNTGHFLRQTIESILQQSYTDYEHVLVDGASTDETLKILEDYKHIRWISEPDRSADEGFCKALAMARGEYVMICCVSDGYLDRDWFGKCVEVLDNDPEVSLVYGIPQCIMEDGSLGRILFSNFMNQPPPQKMEFFFFWLGTFAGCSEITSCVRADVFRRCFPQYEPSDYFLRNHTILGFTYNFNTRGYLPYFLPVIASYGRYHHGSNSARLAKQSKIAKQQYLSAVMQYGNEVLSGNRKHVFRNGRSEMIKMIEPHELILSRQRVLDYRINCRAYLGKKHPGGLSYYLRKYKILLGYYFSGHRICN